MRSRVPLSQKEKLTEQGHTKSRKAAQVPDTKAGPPHFAAPCRHNPGPWGSQLPSPTPHPQPGSLQRS